MCHVSVGLARLAVVVTVILVGGITKMSSSSSWGKNCEFVKRERAGRTARVRQALKLLLYWCYICLFLWRGCGRGRGLRRSLGVNSGRGSDCGRGLRVSMGVVLGVG